MHWQAEQAFMALSKRVEELEETHRIFDTVRKWPKDRHLASIQASGHFRYSKEILVHHVESGNAERLVGLAMSQGSVEGFLKIGLSEKEIGLTALRADATRLLGGTPLPWYVSYRVRLGVK
jgi:hypothetical protein